MSYEPYFDFYPTSDELPDNAETIVGLGLIADTHGLVYLNDPPFTHVSNLRRLFEIYKHFERCVIEFAGERKSITRLIGLGDLISFKGPVCLDKVGTVELLKVMFQEGLKNSVVGNHETLFGADFFDELLKKGRTEYPDWPQYTAGNLFTYPTCCFQNDFCIQSAWITTEEAATDLGGDNPFIGPNNQIQVMPWKDALQDCCHNCGKCELLFAHAGFIKEKNSKGQKHTPISLEQEVKKWASEYGGPFRFVFDSHTHIPIPPPPPDSPGKLITDKDIHAYAGGHLHFIEPDSDAQAIALVIFALDNNNRVIHNCLEIGQSGVPYKIHRTENYRLAKEDREPSQWEGLIEKEEALTNKSVSLDWSDWEANSDDKLGSHLAWYACKTIYMHEDLFIPSSSPYPVVLNAKSVTDWAIGIESMGSDSPFSYRRTPSELDNPLHLLKAFRPSSLMTMEINASGSNLNKIIEKLFCNYLNEQDDKLHVFPENHPIESKPLTVLIPAFLTQKMQNASDLIGECRYMPGIALNSLMVQIHLKLSSEKESCHNE